MDQLPVTALALEMHAGHVQSAIAQLQMEIVRSAQQHAFTPPKLVEPANRELTRRARRRTR